MNNDLVRSRFQREAMAQHAAFTNQSARNKCTAGAKKENENLIGGHLIHNFESKLFQRQCNVEALH